MKRGHGFDTYNPLFRSRPTDLHAWVDGLAANPTSLPLLSGNALSTKLPVLTPAAKIFVAEHLRCGWKRLLVRLCGLVSAGCVLRCLCRVDSPVAYKKHGGYKCHHRSVLGVMVYKTTIAAPQHQYWKAQTRMRFVI